MNINKNKKASGEAISSLILFVTTIIISTGLVIYFQGYVSETQESLDVKKKTLKNKIDTNLVVINAVGSEVDNLKLYVKNIGDSVLDVSKLDIFLDNQYYYNSTFYDAQNVSKVLLNINPQQVFIVEIPISISFGTHKIKLSTQYGNVFEDEFNYS